MFKSGHLSPIRVFLPLVAYTYYVGLCKHNLHKQSFVTWCLFDARLLVCLLFHVTIISLYFIVVLLLIMILFKLCFVSCTFVVCF